jgi:toxin ParE1/3/4
MKIKPVLLRELAGQDVEVAIAHYLSQASRKVALGFVDALERACTHISQHPATGSTRYAQELKLPGLRCRRLKRFPHLVFYVERDDYIDVWRILHSARDLPAWLRDDADVPR